ncbi:hypothetical protein G7054_g5489 [Neopestalotiopsis clavispora]|nr:hypothetical protein G7054_g5489 [Neopestalotiopsis clavispora]
MPDNSLMTHPHVSHVSNSIQNTDDTTEPRIPLQIRRQSIGTSIQSNMWTNLRQCQARLSHLQEGSDGQNNLQDAINIANSEQSTCNSNERHIPDYRPRPLRAYYLSAILIVLLILIILTEVAVYKLPDGTKSPSFRSEVHYQNSTVRDELERADRRRDATWSEKEMHLPMGNQTRNSLWNDVQGSVLENGKITKTNFILSTVISAKSPHPKPLITAGVLWPNNTIMHVKNQTFTSKHATTIPSSRPANGDAACYEPSGQDYYGLYPNSSAIQAANGTIYSSSTKPACTSGGGYYGPEGVGPGPGWAGGVDPSEDFPDLFNNAITWSIDAYRAGYPHGDDTRK